ncbi:inhibitor of growth protein 3-like isoform X2 [Clavelina lepadiformis]
MLYLEDYLELIEHLPSDLRERFTDMREMDLQVQNSADSLDGKVKQLFNKCMLKKGKFPGADQVYEEIRSEYYKTLEDADEKVQLANQIYDLVDRHLRKLDQELSKFKMELEADNAGITEILEQRSLELDNPTSQQRSGGHSSRERRRQSLHPSSSSSSIVSLVTNNGDGPPPEKLLKTELISEVEFRSQLQPSDNNTLSNYSDNSLHSWPADTDVNTSSIMLPNQLDFVEEDTAVEVKTNSLLDVQEQKVIHANASQSQINRQISSNKSTNENCRNSETVMRVHELDGINLDSLDTSGEHVSDSSLSSTPSALHRPSRTKKQTSKAAAWVQERMQAEARLEQRKKDHLPSNPNSADISEETVGGDANNENSTVEWNYDPNEPRYCICNQVSYGEMVGCDNDKCPIEWFHYGCVELSEAPKGKWYCPQCTQAMKRRKQR